MKNSKKTVSQEPRILQQERKCVSKGSKTSRRSESARKEREVRSSSECCESLFFAERKTQSSGLPHAVWTAENSEKKKKKKNDE